MSGTGQPPSNAPTPAPNRSNTSGGTNSGSSMNGAMSAPSGPTPGAPPQPRSIDTGAATMGASMSPRSNGALSQGDLNQIVIDYLAKKGYSRTEAMLRTEMANLDADGRPVYTRQENNGGAKYGHSFAMLKVWIDENLDIYKPELRRILWPIFVYAFLSIISDQYLADAPKFFNAFKDEFGAEHEDDLNALQPIALPEHIKDNRVAMLYRENKYRISINKVAFFNMISFLEANEKQGGSVIVYIIQVNCGVVLTERAADDQYSLARMLGRAATVEDHPQEDEGIPGHNPGSANVDRNANSTVLTKLKLGPLDMESDLFDDVQAELRDEDEKYPPRAGKSSLSDEFDRMIKREESEESPNRGDLQIPPSLARDVAFEVQRVKENRDRLRIEGRTGGVAPGVSVCMFTFHNTHDVLNCLDFSGDNKLVAAGTDDSWVGVWSLDGSPMESLRPSVKPGNHYRFIGHSAPVYAVSFSPGINPHEQKLDTGPRFLLSCSSDKSIRLWSLQAWACLVIYKGHELPIWDVQWGPWGHYFLTASRDGTARVWSQGEASALRIMVGHDQSCDVICWHPNGAYVFSGGEDKTVRMWAVTNGYPVRLFTGHNAYLTSISCSPNGKLLASADEKGTIILWDLAAGKLLKRMKGHDKGGIWSLSWSVESNVVVSGGADGTVRVWDVEGSPDPTSQGRTVNQRVNNTKIDISAPSSSAAAAGKGKKKQKEVVTPDQIFAFPTKKTPVYKVKFTRMNLIVAGGANMG